MTETTNEVMAGEGEKTLLEESLTEEGRYIPYSGGCMGWFENSGVLNYEGGNNYLFHTVMQSDEVRSKQFQRWGESFNRRGDRRRVRREMNVALKAGSQAVNGTTRDISGHGVRVQFLDEINLEKGDGCTLQLYETDSTAGAIELEAKVVWSEKIGKIRPVWNMGLTFSNLTPELSEQLRPFWDTK